MLDRSGPARLAVVLACASLLLVAAVTPTFAQQAPQPQGPFLEIYLTNFVYDEPSNAYKVLVSVTDLSQVKAIEPRLLDLATGENTLFGPAAIQVEQSPVPFSLPADQLKPQRKYRLALRAIDRRNGSQYVRRQGQNANDDPLTFASQEFTYTPSQAAAVTFEIDGVNADYAAHKLLIAIHHSTTDRPLRYEVVVSNKSGAALGQIGPADLDLKSRTLSGPIPAALEQANESADYHATVRLFATDDKLVAEQVKDFTLAPAPQPGPFQRFETALVTVPWLGWSLGGVGVCLILSIVVWQVLPRRRRPLPRPHNLSPVLVAAPPRPIVVQSPPVVGAPPVQRQVTPLRQPPALLLKSATGQGTRYVLQAENVTLGRADDNSIQLEDRYASRHQARIVRRGQSYVLQPELDATQPTRLNGEPVSDAQVLSNGDEIEMGRTLMVFAE